MWLFSSRLILIWAKLNIESTKLFCDLEIEQMTLGQGHGERVWRKEYLCKVWTPKVKQSLFYRVKFVTTLRMRIWPWVKVKVKELGPSIISIKYELWRSNSLCSIGKSLMWPWEWKFDLGSRSRWKSLTEQLCVWSLNSEGQIVFVL